MPQQCWSSTPCRRALPCHWVHRSMSIHGPTSQPVPIPRVVTGGLYSWLNLAMVSESVPLPRWGNVGLGPCNQVPKSIGIHIDGYRYLQILKSELKTVPILLIWKGIDAY
ncbi:hypothetical protein llap_12737 [Limosa lapponica baueri]|uniref:Uncharacterized protein n=1 Tax=Limosa lapponica baueri TaxID=1758121 RepID=A0A2I0TT27_LIMLA|nr:hypothetical protein llap_12737 [Limosa lapponica baueri]